MICNIVRKFQWLLVLLGVSSAALAASGGPLSGCQARVLEITRLLQEIKAEHGSSDADLVKIQVDSMLAQTEVLAALLRLPVGQTQTQSGVAAQPSFRALASFFARAMASQPRVSVLGMGQPVRKSFVIGENQLVLFDAVVERGVGQSVLLAESVRITLALLESANHPVGDRLRAELQAVRTARAARRATSSTEPEDPANPDAQPARREFQIPGGIEAHVKAYTGTQKGVRPSDVYDLALKMGLFLDLASRSETPSDQDPPVEAQPTPSATVTNFLTGTTSLGDLTWEQARVFPQPLTDLDTTWVTTP